MVLAASNLLTSPFGTPDLLEQKFLTFPERSYSQLHQLHTERRNQQIISPLLAALSFNYRLPASRKQAGASGFGLILPVDIAPILSSDELVRIAYTGKSPQNKYFAGALDLKLGRVLAVSFYPSMFKVDFERDEWLLDRFKSLRVALNIGHIKNPSNFMFHMPVYTGSAHSDF